MLQKDFIEDSRRHDVQQIHPAVITCLDDYVLVNRMLYLPFKKEAIGVCVSLNLPSPCICVFPVFTISFTNESER